VQYMTMGMKYWAVQWMFSRNDFVPEKAGFSVVHYLPFLGSKMCSVDNTKDQTSRVFETV